MRTIEVRVPNQKLARTRGELDPVAEVEPVIEACTKDPHHTVLTYEAVPNPDALRAQAAVEGFSAL